MHRSVEITQLQEGRYDHGPLTHFPPSQAAFGFGLTEVTEPTP
jgi:hypothetical protein